jgi:solute carrier family 25 (adenine nucleotide translocator) protein 4/5/6/31
MTPAARNDVQLNASSSSPDDDDCNLQRSSTSLKRERRQSLVRASMRDAFAGAAAGAFAKTAVAPIERVKLLMQLRVSSSGSSSSCSATSRAGDVPGGSALQVARSVYETQGAVAFWRGNTPNVVRQAGAAALNFMLMDWYKRAISPIMHWSLSLPSNRNVEDRVKRRKLISSFLSGGLAGGTTTTFLYPIEFMRTRLAMDVGATKETRLYPRGMRDVFLGIWKSDGIKGFYQGYGIALSGVMVYRALHLGGYDALKTEILHRRRYEEHAPGEARTASLNLTMAERFAAAQIVSIVAGTLCYPIDSVRRRLMMQAGQPSDERLYRNSIDCFRKVFVNEGMQGFFLGIGPNIIRSFGGAVLLVGYDVFKGMIGV